jgi:hypothetical protein
MSKPIRAAVLLLFVCQVSCEDARLVRWESLVVAWHACMLALTETLLFFC